MEISQQKVSPQDLRDMVAKAFEDTKKEIVESHKKLFTQVKSHARTFQKSYKNYQYANLNRTGDVAKRKGIFAELLEGQDINKKYYQYKRRAYLKQDKTEVFQYAEVFLEYVREYQGITIRTIVVTRNKTTGDFTFSMPAFSSETHTEKLLGSIRSNLRMGLNKNQRGSNLVLEANESKYIQAFNKLYKATAKQREITGGNGPYWYTYGTRAANTLQKYMFRSYGDLTEAMVSLILKDNSKFSDSVQALLEATKEVTNLSGMLRGDIDLLQTEGSYEGLQVKGDGSETMLLGQVYNLSVVVLTTDTSAELDKKIETIINRQVSDAAKGISDEVNSELDEI